MTRQPATDKKISFLNVVEGDISQYDSLGDEGQSTEDQNGEGPPFSILIMIT